MMEEKSQEADEEYMSGEIQFAQSLLSTYHSDQQAGDDDACAQELVVQRTLSASGQTISQGSVLDL